MHVHCGPEVSVCVREREPWGIIIEKAQSRKKLEELLCDHGPKEGF